MRFKKKKNSKKRGSKFCGYGRGAAHHKGAGNRGGRGRAGTGKRADQKKPSYWHLPVGRRGFTSKTRMKIIAINLRDIQKNLNAWVVEGLVLKGTNGYAVELEKLGYNKLLGNGIVSDKLMIITDFASKNAVEKVKEAGGEVKVLKSIVKKEKKPEDKKKTDKGKPDKGKSGEDSRAESED